MKKDFLKKLLAISIIIISTIAISACGKVNKETYEPKVLTVKTGTSIEKVLDVAKPGDLILIEPGTYKGDIVVSTDDITIRGKERNSVIIDGKYSQDNGIVVASNGVRIQNLTVQGFKINGILFQGGYEDENVTSESSSNILERFEVSHVNALNNGLYGIYAFAAKDGSINNTYSKANADAGIYIGQCKPCNTAVYANNAELNGIGFQGANASEKLYIYENNFSNNRTGIHLVSETKELKAPQESVQVVGNKVNNNNADGAPTTTPDLYGFGIVIAGGNDNLVQNNLAISNKQVGIALVENIDFLPSGNIFRGNESRESGVPFGFDIAYIISGRPDVMSLSNCFENNSYSSSSIDKIEQVLPCKDATPGPFRSQPLRKFEIPPAPGFSTIAIENQVQENLPGNINAIPKKIKGIISPDLTDVVRPATS